MTIAILLALACIIPDDDTESHGCEGSASVLPDVIGVEAGRQDSAIMTATPIGAGTVCDIECSSLILLDVSGDGRCSADIFPTDDGNVVAWDYTPTFPVSTEDGAFLCAMALTDDVSGEWCRIDTPDGSHDIGFTLVPPEQSG